MKNFVSEEEKNPDDRTQVQEYFGTGKKRERTPSLSEIKMLKLLFLWLIWFRVEILEKPHIINFLILTGFRLRAKKFQHPRDTDPMKNNIYN